MSVQRADASTVSTDDQLLIDRCRSGHPDAFGELVSKYQRRLVRSLGVILGSWHDALDVAQEAFLLAFQKLDSFRGESAFYSWLFRIAWNAAASLRRKQRVRQGASLDSMREQTGMEPEDSQPASDPSQSMQTSEDQELLRVALGQLGEDYRTALLLKEIEGLSYEQISALTDSPIGTVRSRIHRARQELRGHLDRALKKEMA
ncbi:MAG: sigma-70 family RNA polymerase sigma factor [Planctomycetota bacterium]|nr:MAG: sigma-70 family RNA polymerase sigma factor [Planctomycetota bacterium]